MSDTLDGFKMITQIGMIQRLVMLRKVVLLAIVCSTLTLATNVRAADIIGTPWDEQHTDILKTFNKQDVVNFVETVKAPGTAYTPADIDIATNYLRPEEFRWADLAGNHEYQLLIVWSAQGTSGWNELWIYRRDRSGKLKVQCISGGGITLDDLRDLDGDGKAELVIPMGCCNNYGETAAGLLSSWYRIYRWKDGEYVEATRDYASFYDKEILPPLEKQSTALKVRVATETEARAAAKH